MFTTCIFFIGFLIGSFCVKINWETEIVDIGLLFWRMK